MKKTTTPKVKKLTIAESREIIEKTGTVFLPMIQVDENTVRIAPADIVPALRALNKVEDHVIFPMLGIAVPARYLLKFAPLMGENATTFTVDRITMQLTITYCATLDSKSRTMIKGMDPLEFEPKPNGITPHNEFHARVVSDYTPAPVVTDPWITKAVSKDDARPGMMKPYGKFSADGYRIHYDSSLKLTRPADHFNNEKLPAQVGKILHAAARVDNIALANVDELIAALKRAKRANKTKSVLYVNGRMDVSAHVGTTGDPSDISTITTTLTDGYQHNGENITLTMSPTYLIDALSGMTGEVIIGISDPTDNGGRRVYISDGKREAVVMSMLND